MRRSTAMIALMLLSTNAATSARAQQGEDGYRSLVEGTNPEQFTLVGIDSETITIGDDGEVALTGKPNGYFATKASYDNYILRFDWMYEKPEGLEEGEEFKGNSGLLLHIEEPHKIWPKCTEVQLQNADAGHTFAINGARFEGKQPADARKKAQQEAIKPVGEWNSEEVLCRDGTIECKINGILIDTGVGASPDRGPIGWQSEGQPIRFRNLRIRPIE